MNRAVFLDRDGVINKNIYNPVSCEYESPHYEKDFELFSFSIDCIKKLNDNNFLLFIVSNQPSYAKGKTSLENLKSIEMKFKKQMDKNKIIFSDYYYCYHHPDGIIPEYTGECECRKPKPYFLLKAKKEHNLDMKKSWLIGDRDTDIFCGKNGGVKTILIKDDNSKKHQGKSNPDFIVVNLSEAVKIILKNME